MRVKVTKPIGLVRKARIPPQVRVKDRYGLERTFKDRITPVGAGKRVVGGMPDLLAKDHPRRCG